MTLTAEQATARAADQTRDRAQVVKSVKEYETGYDITLGESTGFVLSKEQLGDVDPPAVGDQLTLYTRGWSWIRGVDLRGEPLYYKTDAELEAEQIESVRQREAKMREEFGRNEAELDAKFDSLPPVFQRRVQWFRDHAENFRWEHEAYELSSCIDAVKIAEAMKTPEAVREFGGMDWDKQREAVPDLFDGHSGNSFQVAVRLAWSYLTEPLLVVAEHGALTPLTGCEDYGCAHPREADVVAAVEALQTDDA